MSNVLGLRGVLLFVLAMEIASFTKLGRPWKALYPPIAASLLCRDALSSSSSSSNASTLWEALGANLTTLPAPTVKWEARQQATDRSANLGPGNEVAVDNATHAMATAATGTIFPPGTKDGACVGGPAHTEGVVAAVVVFTFNRADYLERTLNSLLEVHGRNPNNKHAFPLFVSQDGNDSSVSNLILQYLQHGIGYLQHGEEVLDLYPWDPPGTFATVYYHIANHYRFALRTLFDCFGFERVILLEDDMVLAPDFFSYFQALAPVLDADPTLWCISSWNDHGQGWIAHDAKRLYRTDFFPGLGWMTNRDTWDSIKHDWPRSYWDDWMRLPGTRRGRQCIRPEVCRNYNIGQEGSSGGENYLDYLAKMHLNTENIPWTELDLSYLEPDRYDREFNQSLSSAQVVGGVEAALASSNDVVLYYSDDLHYESLAAQLGILPERREGTLRAAYRETVTLRTRGGALLFLAPAPGHSSSQHMTMLHRWTEGVEDER